MIVSSHVESGTRRFFLLVFAWNITFQAFNDEIKLINEIKNIVQDFILTRNDHTKENNREELFDELFIKCKSLVYKDFTNVLKKIMIHTQELAQEKDKLNPQFHIVA